MTDLDALSLSWKEKMEGVDIMLYTDLSKHRAEKNSVYKLTVRINDADCYFYFGRTAGSRKAVQERASKHKSAIKVCHVTTRTGISKLFKPEILGNAKKIELLFSVVHGGLTLEQAKKKEVELSDQARAEHGESRILTIPK